MIVLGPEEIKIERNYEIVRNNPPEVATKLLQDLYPQYKVKVKTLTGGIKGLLVYKA